MAFLPDRRHVRLRSCLKGTYLHDDKNVVSISQTSHCAFVGSLVSLEGLNMPAKNQLKQRSNPSAIMLLWLTPESIV